ncbi:enoyl-CoA hydratase-related protein [Frankia sp. CiP1_Cm_nod2]|uniref:enoyl-CoA hydratase-related protein n=1 Tax=Frankia sp. CiP1_Cm_nod2 TaxID=2897161 RepID=UPI0020252C9C
MAKVLHEKHDRIACITLNQPEVHNAIDDETDQLLLKAWVEFRTDSDACVAILTVPTTPPSVQEQTSSRT